MTSKMVGDRVYVPLTELVKPREGHCMIDRWWVVHPEHGVIFHKGASPQCNHDRRITEKLAEIMYPECEVQFVPVAYVGLLP